MGPWPLIPGNNLGDLNSVPSALQNLSLGDYANGSLGATPTIDWTRGTTQTATLDANCTLTFTAPNKPGPLRLFLTEDGTGNHTITLPGNGVWVQGVPPYPMAATLQRELQIDYDGSTYWVWYSPSSGDNYLDITTATSTTALTASSPPTVELTGTATHQVYLPDIATLYKGWSVNLFNSSTGNVLLRSFDGSLITTLLATGGHFHVVCRATTGSQPVAWLIGKVSLSAGVVGTLGKANGGTGEDNSTGGTANTFWARPNGATGAATYRAIVAADIPDLSATYLTVAAATSGYQPLDADLTALAALDSTAGFLVKTGANTYTRFGAITTITPSTTPTVGFASNPNQSLALSGNTTFTFTDPSIACYVAIKNSDSVGGRTRTWPGNVTWISGRAPRTLNAGETQIVFGWFDGATHWMDYTPSAKDRVTITSTTTNADADISTSTAEFHLDDTAGSPAIIADIKDAGGTVTHPKVLTETNAKPTSNDGYALGSATVSWADLFLASGGVINFANGNAVITHSSGIITVSTGDLRVTTAGTNSASAVTVGATQTLTGKTLIDSSNVLEEITTTTSSATPTPTGGSLRNLFTVTALAAGATFAAPSGTPANGNRLLIRIKDNGSAQTLAYNAIYRAIGVTLPTTTVISKTLYLGCVYNSADSKWDVLAVGQEA